MESAHRVAGAELLLDVNADVVVNLIQQALETTILVSAPLLLAALVTGLVVSVFQAATQINEMTLSFIPKLVVIFLVAVIAGPWMLSLMVDFTRRLFTGIPGMIG
jgi:flagellar biosynthetic protein FliQ